VIPAIGKLVTGRVTGRALASHGQIDLLAWSFMPAAKSLIFFATKPA
jgi:hypothetical protein